MTGSRRPVLATYRLQLSPAFGFDAAAAVVPYLARLGVSHLYASPYLQAAPGSTHGYDVVDHSRVNDELGGPAAYERLLTALDQHGLGLVPDVVPNHMAVGVPAANRWWWDVLEDGPASPYADHFDVDWDPPEAKLAGQILVPVLGDHYGRALDAGELRLRRDGAAFAVEYFDHRFPVAPRSLDGLLADAARRSGSDEAAFLADAHGALPRATDPDGESRHRRHRDKEVLRSLLERLLREQPSVAAALDEVVAAHNADRDRLDALLRRQNYRLARWRTATEELDYRRFFDIATLAALRTDRAHVWNDVHRLVLEGYRAGAVDGFRIDHPDGLADPAAYLERLRAEAPDAWLVVEKILEPGEALPPWPVAGTTGYDFCHQVGGLLVDTRSEQAFTQLYRTFTGEEAPFDEVVTDGKRLVLQRVLAADVSRLIQELSEVCERHRQVRDFTRAELRTALEAVAVHFPVYRTYLRAGREPEPPDEAVVARAVAGARADRSDVDPELFDLLERLLLLRLDDPAAERVALRFQQLTGPTMAKGVEDTAFYRYHRLICLNEVGGDPRRFGVPPPAFHRYNQEIAERWPATMLATSTHDTKRSEDVRARLALLSEMPERWTAAVERWSALNERHRRAGWPDRNAEYLLYQTLVGAHPLPVDRALAFMEKASREAKQHTSWIDPDPTYDEALADFVRAVLADQRFLGDLEAFVAPLVEPGRVNSLAQTLLKLTSPGVADLYQGSELWTDGLVDPDNRRPVDFPLRCALLEQVGQLGVGELLERTGEGLPKLALIARALELRRRRPELFLPGPASAYRPLEAGGERADHVVAFARGTGVCVVVPRLPLRLAQVGGWRDTTVVLPPGGWRHELTGEVLPGGDRPLAELLARFPVALLSAASNADSVVTGPSVWAPRARRVELEMNDGVRLPLERGPDDWWRPAGDLRGAYRFVVDGDPLPDPRSPWQPQGIAGASHTVDHSAFEWTDAAWHGLPLASAVLYELHVGTFSPPGTFDGVVDRLDHLVELGVNAVELMPVAEFPGRRGWGYDGVLLSAPHHAYGGPDGLKRLVDACHRRGLAVVLDVVYNHLGPSGNHLARFGPYFTDRYRTPWGEAVNLDGPGSDEVRRFIVDNALGWLADYHVDGLRLDAVHALADQSATHLLEELADEVHRLGERLGRQLWVIAESDLNDPRLVRAVEAGGYGLDASWSDDFHHAVHVLLTGEHGGYYAGYDGWADLRRTLEGVYAYDGRFDPHRGRRHGRPVGNLARNRFLGYAQNHDQIGNRARGERLSQLVGPDQLALVAALVLTAPFVPMLFEGEEWGASTPFLYVTDHQEPDLAEAVRRGRRAEFAAFGWRPEDVPDPQDPANFEACKLRWDELERAPHDRLLAWHRRLSQLRRRHPSLSAAGEGDTRVRYDEASRWLVVERGSLAVAANLADRALTMPLPPSIAGVLAFWGDQPPAVGSGAVRLGAGQVAVLGPEAGGC